MVRQQPPRRFERAAPNQLWQSDIFTFLLRRHERLYLAAFMDDHSRFIVSYALAHRQKAELVMEALERGIAEYGTPREILTDQGRQYVSWRGRTAFAEELRRQGIEHIKSRPQHPQTLGKVERFWKTLWEEFLSRTVFADFADCDRRLRLFIGLQLPAAAPGARGAGARRPLLPGSAAGAGGGGAGCGGERATAGAGEAGAQGLLPGGAAGRSGPVDRRGRRRTEGADGGRAADDHATKGDRP